MHHLLNKKVAGLAVLTALALGVLALMASSARAQDDMGAPPSPPAEGNGPYGATPAPPDSNAPPDANADQGDDSASFQTFYDALSDQGTWVQSSDYGYVWQPEVTDPDWAPYTEGNWVYSDDGWTWVSVEPWGWATYHYGRWVNLNGTGWCWVPGYRWAPAWVSWRYGHGYCGWAPLPPDSFVGIDYAGAGFDISLGFHIGGDCDSYYGIGAGCYHFVPVNCLGYASYHNYYAKRYDNYAIINQTTNVTNINVTKSGAAAGAAGFRRVTTGGPSFLQVNAVSQTPVQQVKLVRTGQPGGGGTLANGSLALYAPHLNAATSPNVHPARVAGTIGPAQINRGIDITQPLAVNAHLTPPALTAGQIQRAQLAQFNAPIRAKVVTTNTPVTPILQAPLSTLQPVTATAAVRSPTVSTEREQTPAGPVIMPGAGTVKNQPAGGNGAPRVYEPSPSYPQTAPATAEPHSVYPGATSGTPAAGTHTVTPQPSAPVTGTSTRPVTPQPYSPPASSGGGRSSGGGYYPGGSSGGGTSGGGTHGGYGPSGNGSGNNQGQGH